MGKINYKKIISIVKEAGEILLEAANNKLEIKEKIIDEIKSWHKNFYIWAY